MARLFGDETSLKKIVSNEHGKEKKKNTDKMFFCDVFFFFLLQFELQPICTSFYVFVKERADTFQQVWIENCKLTGKATKNIGAAQETN